MSAPKKDGQPDFQGLIFIWFSSDFWQKKAQNAFPSESQVLRRTESHPIPFYYSILRIAGRNCFWEENSKYSNDNDNGRSFLNQSKVSLSPNFAQSEFDKCSASGRGRVPLSSEDQFEEQSICLANILVDLKLCFLKFVAFFLPFFDLPILENSGWSWFVCWQIHKRVEAPLFRFNWISREKLFGFQIIICSRLLQLFARLWSEPGLEWIHPASHSLLLISLLSFINGSPSDPSFNCPYSVVLVFS